MRTNTKLFIAAGLLVALALGLFASPFASGSPDGLERVAIDEGFDDRAADHDLAQSPVADYGVRGVDGWLSTGMAGVIGVVVTFGVGLGAFALVRALRPSARRPGARRAPTSRTG